MSNVTHPGPFIWRDQHDPSMYHLGISVMGGDMVCWASIDSGGLDDMFRNDIQFRDIGTVPVPINLTMSLAGV